MPSVVRLSDEQFYQVCHANRNLRLELTADGELIICLLLVEKQEKETPI